MKAQMVVTVNGMTFVGKAVGTSHQLEEEADGMREFLRGKTDLQFETEDGRWVILPEHALKNAVIVMQEAK